VLCRLPPGADAAGALLVFSSCWWTGPERALQPRRTLVCACHLQLCLTAVAAGWNALVVDLRHRDLLSNTELAGLLFEQLQLGPEQLAFIKNNKDLALTTVLPARWAAEGPGGARTQQPAAASCTDVHQPAQVRRSTYQSPCPNRSAALCLCDVSPPAFTSSPGTGLEGVQHRPSLQASCLETRSQLRGWLDAWLAAGLHELTACCLPCTGVSLLVQCLSWWLARRALTSTCGRLPLCGRGSAGSFGRRG